MKKAGFTLIEVMVVVSIFALLASIILASLTTARAKARDARRIQDLHQIQNAVELYAVDHGGNYPGWYGWWDQINNASYQTCPGTGYTCAGDSNPQPGPITALQPTYISKIPDDPSSTAPPYPDTPPTHDTRNEGLYYYYYGRQFQTTPDGSNLIYPATVGYSPSSYVICTQLESPKYTFDNPLGRAAWGSLNYCVGSH